MKYFALLSFYNCNFIFFNLLTIENDKHYTLYKGNDILRDDFESFLEETINHLLKDNERVKLTPINRKQFLEYSRMRGEKILNDPAFYYRFVKKFPEVLI